MNSEQQWAFDRLERARDTINVIAGQGHFPRQADELAQIYLDLSRTIERIRGGMATAPGA